ncbi:hypothetical protein [Collinsella sp. An2]|uniref:hypothetical protein n=1 Tax=Collinsella sp. An2 TaxID=1965585 RepID=UPI000B3ADA54|nr:hypothetical protein [Collinsella sp. An2]OUP10459.1 hypothetical protein B5F33_02495 [Collinsella sp. An2]
MDSTLHRPDDEAERAATQPDPSEEDTGEDSEPTPEELEQIHRHNALVRALDAAYTDIRQRSYEGKLTTSSRWKKRSFAPEGMDAKAFEEQALLYIQEHDHAEATEVRGKLSAPKPLDVQLEGREVNPDEPLPEPDVCDLALIMGKKAIYLYSAALMSHSFAHALYLTAEDDEVATFVDVVRTESRVYPRPVAQDSFMNPPYLWSPARTKQVYEKVAANEAFKDIHVTHTSKGEAYYYSDWYLSDAQGKALAQWYGVEKGMNP